MANWQAIAAGAGAAVQGGMGVLNFVQQRHANLENWRRQDRLNNLNLEMYHYDNWYNSPAEQMARMRAAGLNPGLMYGGSGSVATSMTPPEMKGSTDIAPQMSGLPTVSDALSLSTAVNQSKLALAQADYYKSLSQTEDQLREERYNALVLSNKNMEKQTEELSEKIKSYADQHRLNEEQVNKLKFDRFIEGKRYFLDKKRLEMDSKLTDKQIDKLDADIQKIIAEKNVTMREYQEMIWTFAIRKAGLSSQVRLTDAQAASANSTARKLGFEGDMLEGRAMGEHDYAASLRGDNGTAQQIIAYARNGLQMAIGDVSGILGVFK